MEFWWRIRSVWNRTDTLVAGTNTFALALFIGNCWWQSVTIAYAAAVLPLSLQCVRAAYVGGTLRDALIFGGLVGWLWPLGEWFVVHRFGWWGEYLVRDLLVLETPIYCILIGWLASTYCAYAGQRTVDAGYGKAASSCVAGLSALGVGVAGENLFVAARLWHYDASAWDWGAVPAFVPIAYGLAYAMLPYLRHFPVVVAALLFNGIMLVTSVGLGILMGFFPR